MKIRKGFVSNSSSSSFIVGIKKSEACPHCGRSDISILEYIKNTEHSWNNSPSVSAEGIEGILEDRCYGIDDIDELKKKLEGAESKGMQVVEFRVSNHDTSILDMIYEAAKHGSIEIIESDSC